MKIGETSLNFFNSNIGIWGALSTFGTKIKVHTFWFWIFAPYKKLIFGAKENMLLKKWDFSSDFQKLWCRVLRTLINRGVMCLRSRRRVKIWTEFHWLMQVTWPVFCDLIGGEGELHWVIWKEVTQNGCFGLNNPFLRHFWRKSSCFLCSSQQCLCKAYTQYHHQRALFQNRNTLF